MNPGIPFCLLIVQMFAKLIEEMQPAQQRYPWFLTEPHDNVNALEKNDRSAMFVLSRLWQVLKNVGLSAYMRLSTVNEVEIRVLEAIMDRDIHLCRNLQSDVREVVLKKKSKMLAALGSPQSRNSNLIHGLNNSSSARKRRVNNR